MTLRNSASTYGSVAKFLHWLIFFAVLGLVIAGNIMEDIDNETLKGTVYMIHKSTGLVVLGLMVLRALWALTNPKPAVPGNPSTLEVFLERSGHYLLYLLLFAMPISGWIMSTAAGYNPSLYGFGSFAFPGIAKSESLAKLANSIHWALGWTIVVMVTLHVLAALWHHYVKKDTVLKRMMPGG